MDETVCFASENHYKKHTEEKALGNLDEIKIDYKSVNYFNYMNLRLNYIRFYLYFFYSSCLLKYHQLLK